MLELVAQFLGGITLSADQCPLLPVCGRCERDFFARVCVQLREPVVMERDVAAPSLALTEGAMCLPETVECPMLGYFVEIGIRAVPEQVMVALEEAITDGEIHWGKTEWNELVPDRSLPRHVRRCVRGVAEGGLWYVGDRDYFSDWWG